MDPPPGRGLILMETWPHIIEMCHVFETERLIVWLKSRQIGASWLLAAYDLWTALFQKGANVLLFSQGEPEAQDKLAKCRLIHAHLPPELQVPVGVDNRSELTFPQMNSSIRALPSTPKAGRSSTGTLVDMDEADFHEYFETNYNAVKPILDDNQGQLILTSTSNAYVMDSLFKRIYTSAPSNGFTPCFYGWDVRPNRDDDWYEARSREYDDPFQFMKEYPASAEAALAPPEQLMAFNLQALDGMKEDVRDAVESYESTRIYKKFQPGRRYAAGTDTSHGVGADFGVTAVLDVASGAVVAHVMSSHLDPESLAYESVNLLNRYGNPIWAIEDNEWGIQTLKTAQRLQYPTLYWRNDKFPGWRTTKASRPILWGELIDGVQARGLTVFAEEGLAQFYNPQRDPKTGKIISSLHDDYPMAVGLAWQMMPLSRPSAGAYKNVIERFEAKRARVGAYKWRGGI